LDISLDLQYMSPITKVWSALTESTLLAKWIMPNDFKPVAGHTFQFRTQPTQWWNGIVECEVLAVEEPHKLMFTWVSGAVNTTVTWTLTGVGETTRLHLEQTGFTDAQAFNGAQYGWTRMGNELEKVLAEL